MMKMKNKKGGHIDRFSFCNEGGGVSPKYAGGGLPFAMLAFPKNAKNHIQKIVVNCQLSCVSFAFSLRCVCAAC